MTHHARKVVKQHSFSGMLWQRQLGTLLPSLRPPNHLRLQDVEVSEEFHHYQRRPAKAHRLPAASCFPPPLVEGHT